MKNKRVYWLFLLLPLLLVEAIILWKPKYVLPEEVPEEMEEQEAFFELPDSDFKPPKKADNSQEGEEGPWVRRVLGARSVDGLHWERTEEVIVNQGDVAELVVDENRNWLFMYYYGWTVGDEQNVPAVAVSNDWGESWVYKYMTFEGFGGRNIVADPDLLYEDGLFRLYGTVHSEEGVPQIVYGESTDGFHFVYKDVAFSAGEEPAGVASTHVVDGTYHLLSMRSLGQEVEEGRHWYATSLDGISFTMVETLDFEIARFVEPEEEEELEEGEEPAPEPDPIYDQYYIGNVAPAPNDLYRLYVFSPMGHPLRSYLSRDGVEWFIEEHNLLELGESKLESGYLGDPDVAQLPDGSYFMAYSSFIP